MLINIILITIEKKKNKKLVVSWYHIYIQQNGTISVAKKKPTKNQKNIKFSVINVNRISNFVEKDTDDEWQFSFCLLFLRARSRRKKRRYQESWLLIVYFMCVVSLVNGIFKYSVRERDRIIIINNINKRKKKKENALLSFI